MLVIDNEDGVLRNRMLFDVVGAIRWCRDADWLVLMVSVSISTLLDVQYMKAVI